MLLTALMSFLNVKVTIKNYVVKRELISAMLGRRKKQRERRRKMQRMRKLTKDPSILKAQMVTC